MGGFSFEGAAGGAASGAAVGGIWGAAAGFVLGGFIGGKNQDKAKKAAQRRERQIAYITSTENYKAIYKDVHGIVAERARHTVGPATRSAAATQASRRGLTGTGLGSAMMTNAAAAPGIAAAGAAASETGNIQNRQLAGIGASPMPGLTGIGTGMSEQGVSNIGGLAGMIGNKIKEKRGEGKLIPGQTPGSVKVPGGGGIEVNLPPVAESQMGSAGNLINPQIQPYDPKKYKTNPFAIPAL